MGISEFSYGVPLPGVKNDILNAQNAFGKKNVKVFMENDVTQTAVLNELRQRGLLLIGTHGVNNSLYPLYSFLVLRSEVGEDASLTAEEIFRCRIQKDVVVLSACYSGLAEKSPLPCDDLFGIQRAMLQGGAGAVIAGMWDVYDMTGPEIIGGMMKHLVAKKSIARALAESQREFLNHARNGEDNVFVHPYFWAVYTLSGNGQIQYQTAQ